MGDKICFEVGALLLLICMVTHITMEEGIDLDALSSGTFVLGAYCFIDDMALSNAYYVLNIKKLNCN